MKPGHGMLVFVVMMLLAAAVAVAGCAPKQTEPTQAVAASDGAALLEARCTVCHGLDRVKSESNPSDAWARIVDRMIDKGAQLTDAEKATLVEYLAATYGG